MKAPEIPARIRRHELLRTLGQPVVSLLTGSDDVVRGTLEQYATRERRALLKCHTLDASAAAALFGHLKGDKVVRGELVAFIADLSPENGDVKELLAEGSPAELRSFAERLRLGPEHGYILRAFVLSGGTLDAPALLRHLPPNPALTDLLRELAEILTPGLLPVLWLSPPANTPEVEWLRALASRLEALAQEAPGLSLCVSVAPAAWEMYHASAPESRAKSLLCQGLIEMSAAPLPAAPRATPSARARAVLLRLPETPARKQAEAGLARAEKLRRTTPDAPAADRDAARSAQEAFLHRVLEAHPSTQGLFRLNQRIRPDRERAMEVDLLSGDLRIAIEVDGYYHFQEAAAFRRDRRKDFRLQRASYLVLRVLAEDVVPRLEEVLDLILTAVHHRQGERNRV